MLGRSRRARNRLVRFTESAFLTYARILSPRRAWLSLTGSANWDGLKGKNVLFERRFADNQLDRLPGLAAELVRLDVDLIVAGGTLAPLADKPRPQPRFPSWPPPATRWAWRLSGADLARLRSRR